jgi:hypothetical protein
VAAIREHHHVPNVFRSTGELSTASGTLRSNAETFSRVGEAWSIGERRAISDPRFVISKL